MLTHCSRVICMALVGFAVWGGLIAPATSSAEPCPAGTTIDYLAPTRHLPKTHQLPADGHLPFAPSHVFVTAPQSLLLKGQAAEVLIGADAAEVSYRLRWVVNLKVAEVDSAGRIRQIVGQQQRRLRQRRSYATEPVQLKVAGLGRVGIYRADITIDKGHHGRLRRYRQYIRVVRPKFQVKLNLSDTSYSAGQTLGARLENHGTIGVTSGTGLQLEAWASTRWKRVDGTPSWFSGPARDLVAGAVGNCEQFTLPTTLSPGQYRVSKRLSVGGRAAVIRAYFHSP